MSTETDHRRRRAPSLNGATSESPQCYQCGATDPVRFSLPKRYLACKECINACRQRVLATKPGPVARFWAKVEKSDHCWTWTAQRARGYGRFFVAGRTVFAHRFAYEIAYGPVPADLSLDHLCRNPSCVRPDHLEAVPIRDNILRGTCPSAMNARKTHCKRGHVLAGDNLAIRGGQRECRACKAARTTKVACMADAV